MDQLQIRLSLAAAGYNAEQIEQLLGTQPMQQVMQPVMQPPMQQPMQQPMQPVQQPMQQVMQPPMQQPMQQTMQQVAMGIPPLQAYDQTALNYTMQAQQPNNWGKQFEQQLNAINESLQKSAFLQAQQPQQETTEQILAEIINPKQKGSKEVAKKKA